MPSKKPYFASCCKLHKAHWDLLFKYLWGSHIFITPVLQVEQLKLSKVEYFSKVNSRVQVLSPKFFPPLLPLFLLSCWASLFPGSDFCSLFFFFFYYSTHGYGTIMYHSQKAFLCKVPLSSHYMWADKHLGRKLIMGFKELCFSKGHIIFINELLNIQVIKTLKNDVLMVFLC